MNKTKKQKMKHIVLLFIWIAVIACAGGKKTVKETENITVPDTAMEKEKIKTQTRGVADTTKNEVLQTLKAADTTNLKDLENSIEQKGIEHPLDTLPKTEERFDHKIWNDLLQKYITTDGKVNYKGFRKDRVLFTNYLTALSENKPDETWGHPDKLAYWINVYNAFTIKLILDNYPVKSIKEIKDPWDMRFFKLGKKWYNLNEIEHQILRKMGDARIHFGINCASFSCPPLVNRAFTANTVDQELQKLAINFINDPLRNRITTNPIELSKIFQWFEKDFRKEGSLIDYLNKYAKVKIPDNARKKFMKYNWDLNEY